MLPCTHGHHPSSSLGLLHRLGGLELLEVLPHRLGLLPLVLDRHAAGRGRGCRWRCCRGRRRCCRWRAGRRVGGRRLRPRHRLLQQRVTGRLHRRHPPGLPPLLRMGRGEAGAGEQGEGARKAGGVRPAAAGGARRCASHHHTSGTGGRPTCCAPAVKAGQAAGRWAGEGRVVGGRSGGTGAPQTTSRAGVSPLQPHAHRCGRSGPALLPVAAAAGLLEVGGCGQAGGRRLRAVLWNVGGKCGLLAGRHGAHEAKYGSHSTPKQALCIPAACEPPASIPGNQGACWRDRQRCNWGESPGGAAAHPPARPPRRHRPTADDAASPEVGACPSNSAPRHIVATAARDDPRQQSAHCA